jgi:AbrB family looped-hinge helix DNA binding protein
MAINSVKITQKGQITIPKAIREKLNTNSVYFEIENNVITLKPVRDAAGSLSEYAHNASGLSMAIIKDKAWEEAVSGKSRKKST